ncbi:MAG: Hpt domain-containing protein [Pseudobdellovibrionaceae bacterium]
MSLDDLLQKMKEEYLEVLPIRIELLKKLTKEKNWEQLEVEFHKLKGTGKTYGFPSVSILCAVFEIVASKQNPANEGDITQAILGLEKILASELAGKTFEIESDLELQKLMKAHHP